MSRVINVALSKWIIRFVCIFLSVSSFAATVNVIYGPLPTNTNIFYIRPLPTNEMQKCENPNESVVVGTFVNGQRVFQADTYSIRLLSPTPPNFGCSPTMTFNIINFDVCMFGLSSATRAASTFTNSTIIFNYQGTSPQTLAIAATNPCTGNLPLVGCGTSITSQGNIACCYSNDSTTLGCDFPLSASSGK